MRFITLTCSLALAATSWIMSPTVAHAVGCENYTGTGADFNGDGYADLAVGDPGATVDGQVGAGRVVILYGDADGRVGDGVKAVLTVDDLGYTPEAGDAFGASLAADNITQSACDGLVVGIPGRDVNGAADAGAVGVFFGDGAGINGAHNAQFLTQAELAGTVEAGDRLGASVAVGNNRGHDYSIIVAGAPGENVGTIVDAGAVHVLHYSGDFATMPAQYTQNSAGVPDSAEQGDQFGAAVALGFGLTGGDNTLWQLLVGAPGESVGGAARAGSVTLLPSIHDGGHTGGSAQLLTQNSTGVPGTAETGDRFGASVAVYSSSTATRRVAVGAPGEAVGSAASAGAVNLFSSTGTSLVPGAALNQNTSGVTGVSEAGDKFGASLSFLSSPVRLAVGAPGEDTPTSNAGLVQVFPITALGSETTYDLASAGLATSANAAYGTSLATATSASERALFVGIPGLAGGRVHVLSWGSTGRVVTPPSGAARFGAAISEAP